MVRHSEKYSADAYGVHWTKTSAIYESCDALWLHRFYYLPQLMTNLDIKVGQNVILSNITRCANLDAGNSAEIKIKMRVRILMLQKIMIQQKIIMKMKTA